MGPIGIVYDASVLVSAVGFGGTPLETVLAGFDDERRLLLSEAVLDEVSRALASDGFPTTDTDRSVLLSILRREAEIVAVETRADATGYDHGENPAVECAQYADADVIVSGDDALLVEREISGVPVVNPETLVAAAEGQGATVGATRTVLGT